MPLPSETNHDSATCRSSRARWALAWFFRARALQAKPPRHEYRVRYGCGCGFRYGLRYGLRCRCRCQYQVRRPNPSSESVVRIRRPNPSSESVVRIRRPNPSSESVVRIRRPNPSMRPAMAYATTSGGSSESVVRIRRPNPMRGLGPTRACPSRPRPTAAARRASPSRIPHAARSLRTPSSRSCGSGGTGWRPPREWASP